MTGKCDYCSSEGLLRVPAEEAQQDTGYYVCEMHWAILKNPETAIPFIRGVVTSRLRGKLPPSHLAMMIDRYMDHIKAMSKRAQIRKSESDT